MAGSEYVRHQRKADEIPSISSLVALFSRDHSLVDVESYIFISITLHNIAPIEAAQSSLQLLESAPEHPQASVAAVIWFTTEWNGHSVIATICSQPQLERFTYCRLRPPLSPSQHRSLFVRKFGGEIACPGQYRHPCRQPLILNFLVPPP